MIGIATVEKDFPLYYEATNEMGLSIAGLNFPENCHYPPPAGRPNELAPFEVISFLLGQCASTEEAVSLLKQYDICGIAYSDKYPLSPLHWMISDREGSVVLEPQKDGLHICENPIGVLTNEPPLDYQMYHLANYMALSNLPPENHLAKDVPLPVYSRGLGAVGLPGDLSSASRFVKAAFTKAYSVCPDTEAASVIQFFHILASVAQQEGCVQVNGHYEKTVYTSCCNTDKGIYYYTTYENSQITCVHLYHENLNGRKLIYYPLLRQMQLRMEN